MTRPTGPARRSSANTRTGALVQLSAKNLNIPRMESTSVTNSITMAASDNTPVHQRQNMIFKMKIQKNSDSPKTTMAPRIMPPISNTVCAVSDNARTTAINTATSPQVVQWEPNRKLQRVELSIAQNMATCRSLASFVEGILHAALPMKECVIHHLQTPGQHGSLGSTLMLYMQPDAKDPLSFRGVVLIPRDLMIDGREIY